MAAGTTLAAQLGVTPLLLFHFHEVPGRDDRGEPGRVPGGLAGAAAGLAAAVLGLSAVALGRFVAFALVPMRYLELIADRLAKAPVAYVTSRGGPWCCRRARRVRGGRVVAARRPAAPATGVVAGAAVVPLVVWSSALSAGPPDGLIVRFFDVAKAMPRSSRHRAARRTDRRRPGRGAGGDRARRARREAARRRRGERIRTPTTSSGCRPCSRGPGRCDPRSRVRARRGSQAELDHAIADEHVPVRHPRAGATLHGRRPAAGRPVAGRCWTGTESDTNNDAIVDHGSRAATTWCCSRPSPRSRPRRWLLETGVDLAADVLKVPHHGAATSVPEFFEAVNAGVAWYAWGRTRTGIRFPPRWRPSEPRAPRSGGRTSRHDHGQVLRRRAPRRARPVGISARHHARTGFPSRTPKALGPVADAKRVGHHSTGRDADDEDGTVVMARNTDSAQDRDRAGVEALGAPVGADRARAVPGGVRRAEGARRRARGGARGARRRGRRRIRRARVGRPGTGARGSGVAELEARLARAAQTGEIDTASVSEQLRETQERAQIVGSTVGGGPRPRGRAGRPHRPRRRDGLRRASGARLAESGSAADRVEGLEAELAEARAPGWRP